MRRLYKGPEPEVLVQNAAAWTQEYLDAIANSNKPPTRYAHPDVTNALSAETRSQCAYCESRMHGVAWSHVEHIHPKSVYPELVVMWPNLTLACPVCNISKRDYASDDAPLVHPYDDEPADHVEFLGSLPFPVFGDEKGRRTIGRLKLGRADLTHEREQRLVEVNKSLEEWFRADDSDRQWLSEGIRLDAVEGEFSACVKTFLIHRGFPL